MRFTPSELRKLARLLELWGDIDELKTATAEVTDEDVNPGFYIVTTDNGPELEVGGST